MEELRSTGSKIIASENSSSFPSLTRNLGREIAEKLAKNAAEARIAAEAIADEEDVETVVTTRRIVRRDSSCITISTLTSSLQTKRAGKVVVSSDAPLIVVEPIVTILNDVDVQTDSIPTSEVDIQTDLSAVNIDLVPFVLSPIVEPVVPPPPKNRQMIQEELARELGVELSTFDEFVEAQKRSPRLANPPPVPTTGIRQRNTGNRWGNRFSTRLPYAATQAPSYFINVFPESTRPYVSSIVTFTAAVYLGGVISGALLMPSTQHYHVSPYHLMVGASDQAAWHQCQSLGSIWLDLEMILTLRVADNNLGAAWGEGIATSGGGNGVGESLFRFVNELVPFSRPRIRF